VNLLELQDVIERTYGERDRDRGVPSTVAWLAEEIGELAQAVRKGSREDQIHEFSDVLAWVASHIGGRPLCRWMSTLPVDSVRMLTRHG